MESFQGPIIPSDVILMCHVAYYFSETFDEQIRRALSWLNKGGRIWLVHDQNTIHKLIGEGTYAYMKHKHNILFSY